MRVEGCRLHDLRLRTRPPVRVTRSGQRGQRQLIKTQSIKSTRTSRGIRRLVKERGSVEFSLHGIIFNLHEETWGLGDRETEERGYHAGYHTDAYHPAPHAVNGARYVDGFMLLAFARCDDDEGDEVSGDLAERLHEEDGGHHASAVFGWCESAISAMASPIP